MCGTICNFLIVSNRRRCALAVYQAICQGINYSSSGVSFPMSETMRLRAAGQSQCVIISRIGLLRTFNLPSQSCTECIWVFAWLTFRFSGVRVQRGTLSGSRCFADVPIITSRAPTVNRTATTALLPRFPLYGQDDVKLRRRQPAWPFYISSAHIKMKYPR